MTHRLFLASSRTVGAIGVCLTSSLLLIAACTTATRKTVAPAASAAAASTAAPSTPAPPPAAAASAAPSAETHDGPPHPPSAWPDPPAAEVSIPSGSLKLRGYVVRPKGAGPFPVVVYNHGSE